MIFHIISSIAVVAYIITCMVILYTTTHGNDTSVCMEARYFVLRFYYVAWVNILASGSIYHNVISFTKKDKINRFDGLIEFHYYTSQLNKYYVIASSVVIVANIVAITFEINLNRIFDCYESQDGSSLYLLNHTTYIFHIISFFVTTFIILPIHIFRMMKSSKNDLPIEMDLNLLLLLKNVKGNNEKYEKEDQDYVDLPFEEGYIINDDAICDIR